MTLEALKNILGKAVGRKPAKIEALTFGNAPNDNILHIAIECVVCKELKTVECRQEGYLAWISKEASIQNALPELSADERELLMSHTCSKCFDAMWEEEEV